VSPEPIYIRISKADNVRHAYLGLEGTILLFGQREDATDSEFQIPVELVTISEGRRFKGARLFAGLLCLVLTVVCGALFFGVASSEKIAGSGAIHTILVTLSTGVFIVGLAVFLVLVAMSLIRVRTVRLHVEPDGAVIEFYKHRRQAAEIDGFLAELRRRQAVVDSTLAAFAKKPMGMVKEHSVLPKLAVYLLLASGPAVFTGKFPLLVLPLGVLAWFAYGQIQYRRQPWEYRQAARSVLRDDFDGAIKILESLRQRLADYVPVYFRLAELLTYVGRFEEALDVVACLARDYPDEARRMQNDIWLFRRIYERRYTDSPGSSDGAVASS